VRPTANRDRVEKLRSIGVELVEGDLKDSRLLSAACAGAETVISTASIMTSSQPGDTVENVDEGGQLALVDAAGKAGVASFVYVSFSKHIHREFPFRNAKRAVERYLEESGLAYTILRPTFYMEVWLAPIGGFDFASARATIYGRGNNPISWLSLQDVAQFVATCLDAPAARNDTIELGGPEALSPLEAVRVFEEIGGQPFELQFVSESQLEEQQARAATSLEESLAGLKRCYADGDVVDMSATLATFPMKLTSVRDYARRVLPRPIFGSIGPEEVGSS
jgi:uncharacterized protein YbjT (DUF2867 family)